MYQRGYVPLLKEGLLEAKAEVAETSHYKFVDMADSQVVWDYTSNLRNLVTKSSTIEQRVYSSPSWRGLA